MNIENQKCIDDYFRRTPDPIKFDENTPILTLSASRTR